MADPAGGVPQQLLPHLHLVSNFRYPTMNQMAVETALEYLLAAPKVVRELQPVHWTFLDGPPDGTVMLTWQPLNHLGSNFASDGYVWAGAEHVYHHQVRGYTVECWYHQCGYHPPHETIAQHSRRRFRIVPSKTPNNLPPPDPSLWIVNYSKCVVEPVPASSIHVVPQVQNILAQRRFLQSQGQLVRKEFMLHDRNSWPTINLPPQVGQQSFVPQGAGFPSALLGRQQAGQFFPPQQGANLVGVQGKQTRGHRGAAPANMAGAAGVDHSLEEEEISTGDLLDLITPRDISRMRYKYNHEWMEEIFASPYKTSQILPVDLGLGKKGELESLTAPFFDAPMGPNAGRKDSKDAAAPVAAGKMEPEKADEFKNAVARKIADVSTEIEQLKKKHARRMESINRAPNFKEAELKLRDSVADPTDIGQEFWRIEGRLHTIVDENGVPQFEYEDKASKPKTNDVVHSVETGKGRSVAPLSDVTCVDRGGLVERIETEEPKPAQGEAGDVDMGNTDTVGQQIGAAQGTVVSQPEDREDLPPVPTTTTQGLAAATATAPSKSEDVEMGGVQTSQPPAGTDQEAGDWVMVNKETVPAQVQSSAGGKPAGAEDSGAAAVGAPASGLQGLTPAANTDMGESGALETSNFDDAANFGTIDSAGEALAAYGEQDGLDLGDLEPSAFGDAFHASEAEHEQLRDTEDIP
ncbi:hypothetical protein AJ80_09412 [Polytolypa hystricis UAMH7299]|uniref:DUF1750-domain-containing protein n=1 Tax=Polytolypa hystricis (strain UAMH7299) TaxID=1447883 RepID=A0A2B7WRF5_POLH7|nr:hypothetical protein AJ80_09412 [Polytolypa hystricis UAMH7299]